MNSEIPTFGQFITEIRTLRGKERGKFLNQAEVCQELGVSGNPPTTLSRIECDNLPMSKKMYERVGKVLGFTLQEDGPYAEDRKHTPERYKKSSEIKATARGADTFGAFIIQLRLDRGYNTQKALSEASRIPNYILSRVEQNLGISSKVLAKLIDILGFTPEDRSSLISRRGRSANNMVKTVFGTSLRSERDALGLSQRKLGELLGYEGKNPSAMISNFERGKFEPSPRIMRKLTKIFDPLEEKALER